MNNRTNFTDVLDFNNSFGVVVNDVPDKKILVENPELVKLRLSLIEEEVNELKDGLKNKDMNEVTDALADILYVVYGAGVSFGIDLDEAFRIVHESNMSKLCNSEKDAEETVDWYIKNQSHRYYSPSIRKSEYGNKWVVYNKSTGKVLKSIYYKPPTFDDILSKKHSIKQKGTEKSILEMM